MPKAVDRKVVRRSAPAGMSAPAIILHSTLAVGSLHKIENNSHGPFLIMYRAHKVTLFLFWPVDGSTCQTRLASCLSDSCNLVDSENMVLFTLEDGRSLW